MSDAAADANIYSAIKVQALIRRFIVRRRELKKVFDRFEKIYDPKRKRYYYYDKTTNSSSWLKPPLLTGGLDIPEVAPTYSPEQAALKIQTKIRQFLARQKVRLIYQTVLTTITDWKLGKVSYYNPQTGASFDKLPKFMNGRMDYKKKKKAGDKVDSGSDSEDSDALSMDSETRRMKRRMKRKFPR
jgi:hypothetical protein